MTRAPERATRRGRWTIIVAASVLAHLVLLDALPRWTVEPGDALSLEPPLHAMLVAAATPTAEPNEPAPTEPASRPTRPPARPSRPSTAAPAHRRIVASPTFVPQSLDPEVPSVAVVDGDPTPSTPRPTPGTGSSSVATVPAIATPPVDPKPLEPTGPPLPPVDAPSSARLVYKVVAIDQKNFNAVHYYGTGSIDFVRTGDHYRSDLVARLDILFAKIDVLASHSEGSLGVDGLAPDRYTETPRKRAMRATNFNRDERRSITFSASPASVPLPAGAQDRLSVLFQVGGLLRGGPALAVAGARLVVPVAGLRGDVDPWTFETIGTETIEPGIGRLPTVHLRRTPQAGSNDRTIDVWIALEAGGYPARILYAEPDGSTYDLMLERIEALGAPSPTT